MQQQTVERRPVPSTGCTGDLVDLIPSLRAFAIGLCRSREAADDLVYQTLLEAILNIERRHQAVPLRAWLFTIMRNAFHTGVWPSRQVAAETGSPMRGPRQPLDLRQGTAAGAVAALPPEQREAVMLVDVLGVGCRDAAGICGCSLPLLERRLDRGRQALAVSLAGRRAVEALRRA